MYNCRFDCILLTLLLIVPFLAARAIESYTIRTRVSLNEEVWIQFGQSSILSFSVSRRMSPPLEDCKQVSIQAIAHNPHDTFRKPQKEAILSIGLSCLACEVNSGQRTYYTITGRLGGPQLVGKPFKIRAAASGQANRYGLTLSAHAEGVAEIESLSEEQRGCWIER